MALQEKGESNKIFATVISDGSIRVKVDENTQGAVKREYETASGEKGFKWEKVYASLTGNISKLEFKDTDYGQFMDIEIDGIVLSLNTDGSFAQDLMKKLPNIDLLQEIKLTPYSFLSDGGKKLKGISVIQNGEKIKSAFWDGEKNLNGIPEVKKEDGEKYKKDDWKIHFMLIKKFLIEYTENNIIPNIKTTDDNFREVLDKAGVSYTELTPEDFAEGTDLHPEFGKEKLSDDIKIENIPF